MKVQKHLLAIDFESWVVSKHINRRNLNNKKLRELDGGYTRNSLDFVLKKLKQKKQKTTFFLVFKLEELFPGIIDKIIADGHEIGWHTYSHPRIVSEKILIDELNKSKKLLNKYNVKGFQAPEIYFLKSGYKILSQHGFLYSSSIYGNSNNIYEFDGIYELPVSVSNEKFKPQKDEIKFPSAMTINNLIKFQIPFGSSYFWSILGNRYYINKFRSTSKKSLTNNLFIHNWQIIQPMNTIVYNMEYKSQIQMISNPLFYPYTINVENIFDSLISEFKFQRFIDYVYEKTKK